MKLREKTKGRNEKVVIVQHRGWQIILEPNFPCYNYVLTKQDVSHGFRPAFCSTLESALQMLFDQLLISNIEETDGYACTLVDLRSMILRTKAEVKELLTIDVKTMLSEGGGNV
jgi:hypothetical protein